MNEVTRESVKLTKNLTGIKQNLKLGSSQERAEQITQVEGETEGTPEEKQTRGTERAK